MLINREPGLIFNNGFAELRLCGDIHNFFNEQAPVKSDYYSIVWITQGMVDLVVDDVPLGLDEGQMAFITPSKYIQLGDVHGEAVTIQFNREFYCIRDNDHEVSCEGVLYFGAPGLPLIQLEEKPSNSFASLHFILEEEFEVVDTVQEEMLRTILKKWLIISTRLIKQQNKYLAQDESKSELLRQFRILLEKHFHQQHAVSFYADVLHRSPKTLANQFKLLGQEPPKQMIQQRVMAEAKRYLMYSELSVKEISYRLGFDAANTFTHYFNKISGISPTQFRSAYRAQ
ncbi:MAG TPA: AraC family transcriptional regulator [Cytophagales bacterium]|nr:AraC family transcriptional regulator [Cytophagales bacterium]HAA19992.1 AraC family transcriptional regulator [Cytophagales bacterium]HAP63642.1 AraC family transcriptional regulator [Cytophagales bacterium]